jgi:hypothetical protein
MKITESKIRRIIREELSRSLLTEGAPLLFLAPGVVVTAGELAASAGVSLYLAYMWMTEQDSYEGPAYETPQELADDLGITLEEVLLSPDYEGRGPSQPHGGFDPAQVGGASPGHALPGSGGRPRPGSPGYREYEAALREKEMIIARARKEISEMDIDIDKIFDLNANRDPDEDTKCSSVISICCFAWKEDHGVKLKSGIRTYRPRYYYYYFAEDRLPTSFIDDFCHWRFERIGVASPAWERGTFIHEISVLPTEKNPKAGNPPLEIINQIKDWACSRDPQAGYISIRDYSAAPYCGHPDRGPESEILYDPAATSVVHKLNCPECD